MIETPEVTIAENPEEAFWAKFREARLQDIKTGEREIVINNELVKLAEEKLKEVKDGK